MAKRKTLDKWILECLTDSDKDTALTNLTLFHMRGTLPIELHTWTAKQGVEADAKKLADLFLDKAQTYAQDLDGTQTFNLCAFYGKSVPEAQMPFKVTVEADMNSSGLSTEEPTERGRTQQSMRWAENLQAQVYRRQQVMDDHAIRMIEQQSRMIDSLQADRFSAADMIVQMMMREADNRHKLEMERLAFERSSQERKALIGLAPALVNSLTGKDVFPQSSADSALIDSIAENLTEEHVQKLMELDLPAALSGPLMTRVLEARQKKAREEERRRLLPKGNAEHELGTGEGE
jgi:hypothetical protein